MTKESTLVKTYSETDKGLVVELQNGAKYLYPDATKAIVVGLDKAESKGKYFNKHIRSMTNFEKLA